MKDQTYQRFAISMPPAMAERIEQVCRREGRSRSEFFREAVRAYFAMRAAGPAQPRLVFPREGEEAVDDPFQGFAEWASEADSVYDQLG
ncbi:MAG: ribbon-helix-helix protein, CopG family [Betaproteobacteria bacterium]|nr:ribbon-helix-helix protein, CopG family [Betaproteobacteria bacterium]